MTEKQQKLHDALKAYFRSDEARWVAVVDAATELSNAIKAGEEIVINTAFFPSEILHAINAGAIDTAWIYNMLTVVPTDEVTSGISQKIFEALGYQNSWPR